MRLSFIQEVLLAVAAALALLLLVEVWLVIPDPSVPESAAVIQTPPSTAPSDEAVPVFALPPRESLSEFVQHPLFERTRRAAGEAYATSENTGEIADVTLIGIVIASNERIAVLRVKNGTRPFRVRTGDAVGEWQVAEITQNSILLRNKETVQWVSLPGGR